MLRHFYLQIFLKNIEESEGPREAWMYIAELCSNNFKNEESNVVINEEY